MGNPESRKLNMARAISEAIAQEMRIDESVFCMGEDIRYVGGIWGHTAGLHEEFGDSRVIDTPISETAFIGAGAGAAMAGMRPIVELMFADFFGVCMNSIYSAAAKTHFMSGGQVSVPMVINTAVGGGYGDAAQHSQCLYSTFAHMPGLKVVMPSNANDAKGLMTAAIRDDNPVVFMLHKNLLGVPFLGDERRATNSVPRDQYTIPLETASIVREGNDITFVSIGVGVYHCLTAADQLAAEGVNAEVIDAISIAPLDRERIAKSVKKTGHLVVVEDDYRSYGFASEVVASVTESCHSDLKRAPLRITYPDVSVPFSPPLEDYCLPNPEKVKAAASALLL
ncbi:MAG: alpha-ketoacid dehydrogenase subunit beta [Pseudohongiellaceae bacterium]